MDCYGYGLLHTGFLLLVRCVTVKPQIFVNFWSIIKCVILYDILTCFSPNRLWVLGYSFGFTRVLKSLWFYHRQWGSTLFYWIFWPITSNEGRQNVANGGHPQIYMIAEYHAMHETSIKLNRFFNWAINFHENWTGSLMYGEPGNHLGGNIAFDLSRPPYACRQWQGRLLMIIWRGSLDQVRISLKIGISLFSWIAIKLCWEKSQMRPLNWVIQNNTISDCYNNPDQYEVFARYSTL